jgi:hypothetical protein
MKSSVDEFISSFSHCQIPMMARDYINHNFRVSSSYSWDLKNHEECNSIPNLCRLQQ